MNRKIFDSKSKSKRIGLTVENKDGRWGISIGLWQEESEFVPCNTRLGAITVARLIGQPVEKSGGNAELTVMGADSHRIKSRDSYGYDPVRSRG